MINITRSTTITSVIGRKLILNNVYSNSSGYCINGYFGVRNYSTDGQKGGNSQSKFEPSDYFKSLYDLSGEQLKAHAESTGAKLEQGKQKDTNYSNMSFVDKLRIKAKAGDGGSGSVHFFRAKYIPEGPPDGGNGGDGASVIVRANMNDNNLSHLSRNYVGENGEKGKGGKKTGKKGEDIILSVPPGTIIKEVEFYYEGDEELGDDASTRPTTIDPRLDNTSDQFDADYYLKSLNSPFIDGKTDQQLFSEAAMGMSDDNSKKKKLWREVQVLADMNEPGQELVLLQGGKGGKGNFNFATGSNRSPNYAQSGTPGEQKYLEFELKIIADIGLVGYPNAGKSTLLSRVSNAIPKIRNYPFTTLRPYVGVVDLNTEAEHKPVKLSKRPRKVVEDHLNTTTLADLPGILEGAHLNIGLGLDFLRHIERTKVLCFVIDMSNEGVPAIWDGKKLRVRPNRYAKYRDDESSLKRVTETIRNRSREIEKRTPWNDYITLVEELESYSEGLSDKPSVIIANKMDQPYAQDHLEEFKKLLSHIIKPSTVILPISSTESDQSFTELKKAFKQLVKSVN
ncbi:GTP1/OBG family protein [Heterostelium album PN500]|uniref:GTP1/OBG family protein n=1 Tax=Heterostelium pallidum (strain ATCC 26659 / Pp 5 / PN500) TaxID=670386 RepID=D3B0P9_HETP5|nr:GTP1/OBG family protein [Heterostelium album PN500]EFA84873.1 GTP1/OBG family protein [Heterostelium album PN500]|eukprot:XP_020436984.1 GTP1/OBG family protein [Heterostelium album PN500]